MWCTASNIQTNAKRCNKIVDLLIVSQTNVAIFCCIIAFNQGTVATPFGTAANKSTLRRTSSTTERFVRLNLFNALPTR